MTPKSYSLNLNPAFMLITMPHLLKALMIRGLQFLEAIPHWSWLLLGRQDVKKNIKLILIRNWRHKSLWSQIVSATAELFMQLFMHRIALWGWAICCCFCSEDPAPQFQCWNQGFRGPAWTAWVVMFAKFLVPCSGEWMGCHNTSVSLTTP